MFCCWWYIVVRHCWYHITTFYVDFPFYREAPSPVADYHVSNRLLIADAIRWCLNTIDLHVLFVPTHSRYGDPRSPPFYRFCHSICSYHILRCLFVTFIPAYHRSVPLHSRYRYGVDIPVGTTTDLFIAIYTDWLHLTIPRFAFVVLVRCSIVDTILICCCSLFVVLIRYCSHHLFLMPLTTIPRLFPFWWYSLMFVEVIFDTGIPFDGYDIHTFHSYHDTGVDHFTMVMMIHFDVMMLVFISLFYSDTVTLLFILFDVTFWCLFLHSPTGIRWFTHSVTTFPDTDNTVDHDACCCSMEVLPQFLLIHLFRWWYIRYLRYSICCVHSFTF